MGPPHPSMFGPGHPAAFPGAPEHWPYGPGPEFGPIPDYQFNNNNEPIKKRRGRKKRKVDEFAAMNGYMEVRSLISPVPSIHCSSLFRVTHLEWRVMGLVRRRPSEQELRLNITS